MFGPRIELGIRNKQNPEEVMQVELDLPRDEEQIAKLGAKWLSDNRVRMYLLMDYPLPVSAERRWLEDKAKKEDEVHWFIYLGGQPIGGIGLHRIDFTDRKAEVGLMIGEKDFWGQGIAPAVTAAVLDWGFRNVVAGGLYKITAGAVVENTRSCQTLKKVGFNEVGVTPGEKWINGRWYSLWLGYLLSHEWRHVRESKLEELEVVSLQLYPGCEVP